MMDDTYTGFMAASRVVQVFVLGLLVVCSKAAITATPAQVAAYRDLINGVTSIQAGDVACSALVGA